jgi:hypothetical protein
MNAVVKRAPIIVELLTHGTPHNLDPILVPTDRILERWAVSQGSEEYLVGWQDVPPRSRPPPLSDDMAILVDRVILAAPVQTRNFVMRWYLRPGEPVCALAKALGLHRDSVLMRWRSTLWYMRTRLQWAEVDV